MKAIGIKAFLEKSFEFYEFEGKWKESFGQPEKNFKAIIYGASGNGKTEFCIQLAKYLSSFGKVYYNSYEQGISKTLQDALLRNNMMEVAGRVMFGDKEHYNAMLERIGKRNGPKIVIIDSRDYMNLTEGQYKKLVKRFPRKAFILVCWEQAGKPKGVYAKAIEFICDIKIRVVNFKALPRSRFGGNVPFVIWDKGAKSKQGQLF